MNSSIPTASLRLILTAVALVLVAGPVSAEWSHDPYENNPIDVSDYSVYLSTSVTDGRGGTIAVWCREEAVGGGTYDLYVQRIDEDGNPQWGSLGVRAVDFTSAFYSHIVAVSDDNGGAYLAFNAAVGGGSYRVYVQWIRYDGAIPWGTGAREATPGAIGFSQYSVDVVAEGIDGCVVSWADGRDYATTNYDIWAQQISAAGGRPWGTLGVEISGYAESQNYPRMAPDENGGAYIVWRDSREYATRSYDIYAQHIGAGGVASWVSDGRPVSTYTGLEGNPRAVADGQGGVIFAWEHNDGSSLNIRAGLYLVTGDYWWTVNVTDEPGNEFEPELISDGQGGAIVIWRDSRDDGYTSYDLYAQRITQTGTPSWTSGGLRVGAGNGNQDSPSLCSDAAGGVIACWMDSRNSVWHPYAQRISSSGYRMWNSSGVMLNGTVGGGMYVSSVADDRGGIIAVWKDNRPGYHYDVYCQRVDGLGYLGDPSPMISGLVDYPQDQGGVMILDWTPSYLDTYEVQSVYYYTIWRQYAGPAKAAASGPDVEIIMKDTGMTEAEVIDLHAKGWAYIDQVDAMYFDEYSYHVPTYGDFTESETPLTEYRVLAHVPGGYCESDVVSGYSTDNLAPGAPKTLVAQPAGFDIDLDWSAAGWRDEDLAHYRVYRATYAGFPVEPSFFLSDSSDTLFTDLATGPGDFYYRITGIDVHGNESDPSNEATAQSLSAVDGGLPGAVALLGNHPNPFNPSTIISFDLPATMHVRLEVFTVDGRRVAVLHEGSLQAGRRQVAWRGCDDRGRAMASGAYVYRLTAGGVVETGRMTLLK